MFLNIKNFIYLATIPVIYNNIYISRNTALINFIYIFNVAFNYKIILLDIIDKYCMAKIYIQDKINNNKNIINNLLYKIGYYKNKHFEYQLLNAYLYINLSKKIGPLRESNSGPLAPGEGTTPLYRIPEAVEGQIMPCWENMLGRRTLMCVCVYN